MLRKYVQPLLLTMLILIAGCVRDVPTSSISSDVVLYINEIMSTGDPDWLEIYNPGNVAIDLSGFYVYDSGTMLEKWTIPNDTIIAPLGFIVLYCDDQNQGLHTNFKLSSSGDEVWFEDADGNLIDHCHFSAIPDGNSFGRIPDGSGNWALIEEPTPGIRNSDVVINVPPSITSVTHSPLIPTPDDTVEVTAEITDDSGISGVSLFYDAGMGNMEIAMISTQRSDTFIGIILPQPDSTSVSYYISATDDSAAISYSPSDAPSNTYVYTVNKFGYIPPAIFINEFMASNTMTLTDPQGENDDWIELYNAEDSAVNLGGFFLTDDLTNPQMWVFPDTSIAAHGFLLIWADNDVSDAGLHAGLKLGAGGEKIGLFSPLSTGNVPMDTLSFGAQTDDVSYGRYPDGTENWQFFNTPTPDGPNQP